MGTAGRQPPTLRSTSPLCISKCPLHPPSASPHRGRTKRPQPWRVQQHGRSPREQLLLLQTSLQLLGFLLQGPLQMLALPFGLPQPSFQGPSGAAPPRLPGQLQLLMELQERGRRLRPLLGAERPVTAAMLPVPLPSIPPGSGGDGKDVCTPSTPETPQQGVKQTRRKLGLA